MLGDTVGNFRISSELGQGGMGIVYVAEHKMMGKRAAVKVLHAELCKNEEVTQRFFNEAKSATQINHPGIVDVYDFGYHANGSAYIVMELLEGEELSALIKRETRLVNERVASITWQLCSALGAAHQAGIIHRDLKPENIFLVMDPAATGGERVKILDFGIAKLGGDGPASHHLTRTGAVMGTPVYMSPEQCRGSGKIDTRSDIYSLGCIIYEMCTGRPPFVREGFGELLSAHMNEQPPPPRGFDPNIAPGLEAIMLRCLAKDPGMRFATMEEVGNAIANLPKDARGNILVDDRPVLATGTQPASVMANVATAYPSSTTLGAAAAEIAPAPSSGGGKKWLAIGVVGAVAAGGLAFALLGGGGGSDQGAGQAPVAAAPVEEPAPTPAPAAQPPPAPTAPAAPALVPIRVESEPAGAEVFRAFDGLRVGVTPYATEIPPAAGEAIYVIRKSGFKDARVTISASQGGEAYVELDSVGGSRSTKKKSTIKKRPATKKPVKKKPKKPIEDAVLDPFG